MHESFAAPPIVPTRPRFAAPRILLLRAQFLLRVRFDRHRMTSRTSGRFAGGVGPSVNAARSRSRTSSATARSRGCEKNAT
jgi:hypothetical protein